MMSNNYSIFDVVKDIATGNVDISSSDLSAKRIKICEECPERDPTFSVCKQCGCLIPAKVRFSKSSCPLGKW